MALYENIQFHRKRLNMSQEALGRIMSVEVETVEMWESGQTMPTLNNIVRLSEIFSVSVDELLKGKKELQGDTPYEKYVFNYSCDELYEIQSRQSVYIYKKLIVSVIVVALLLLFLIFADTPKIMLGFVEGLLFACILSCLKGYRQYKTACESNIPILTQSTYRYEVYNGYIKIKIFRSGEKIKSYKIYFYNIQNIQVQKNFYLLQVDNQIFIIRKKDLAENSFFHYYVANNPTKVIKQEASVKLIIASDILFALTLCSLFAAMLITMYFSEKNAIFGGNMGLFFTMTPIPVSSIVFGFIAKKKGCKSDNNIISGFIILAILCVCGLTAFMG